MKQFFHKHRMAWFSLVLILWLAAGLFGAGGVWGQVSSGLGLNLYPDKENYPNLQYRLGIDPIKLIVVIKNETEWMISTNKGFSQVDLHQALILTDPNGTRYTPSKADAEVFDVLPSISWNGHPTTKAETLPTGWVRSVIIDDLRQLFPMMITQPGWYKIEANQPFVRFAWTVRAEPIGLLGIQDDPNNWHGTVDSNKLQIYIAPPSGAQLQIRILDPSSQPVDPIGQVPVRVFRRSDLAPDYTPATSWSKTPYVLQGTSNPAGWAVWESDQDAGCLPEAEYVVMAYYLDRYEESAIPQGTGVGWADGCEGSIVRELYFAGPAENTIVVSGGANNYPDGGDVYSASFSMEVGTDGANASGWLKYYYTRSRLYLGSTAITEVTASATEATIKGTGTVNGVAGYSFESYVTDGDPDKFGITIKDSSGNTHYTAPIKNISDGDLKIIINAMVDRCQGDFNSDGDVDGEDLAMFVSNYGKTDCTEPSTCQGNYDGDSDVDKDDVSVFIKDFGKITCPQ